IVYVASMPRETARSYVVIDNARGGLLATKRLLDAGRAPVAFVGSRESADDERFAGYRRALVEHGMACEDRFVRLGDMRLEGGHRLFLRMIEDGDRPRAVFAENDLMALGCLQAARECGLRVPEDVAIVGFDDIPFASFPEVQLTTIRQPTYDMGRMAVDILLGNGSSGRARQVVLEPQLVVRRTG
ncbi:MAG TPA: substrate-binding domain-containing protein, partial [Desulfobacterales bacterium]|nr:substrate-binding domain-containing protein [Desulfobacterales bacterium]